MSIFRTWLFGIMAAAMALSILYALVPKGALLTIAKCTGGLVMLLVVVRPLLALAPGELHLQYEGGGKTVCITGSAGVAVAPDAGTALDVLYKKADAALYQVKQSKKGGFRICEN